MNEIIVQKKENPDEEEDDMKRRKNMMNLEKDWKNNKRWTSYTHK